MPDKQTDTRFRPRRTPLRWSEPLCALARMRLRRRGIRVQWQQEAKRSSHVAHKQAHARKHTHMHATCTCMPQRTDTPYARAHYTHTTQTHTNACTLPTHVHARMHSLSRAYERASAFAHTQPVSKLEDESTHTHDGDHSKARDGSLHFRLARTRLTHTTVGMEFGGDRDDGR